MMNLELPANRTARQRFAIRCGAAVALALTVSVSQSAFAHDIPAPAVPPGLEVDVGNHVSFIGHGVGTQNYVCLPTSTGFAYSLFTPEATLFSDSDRQLTTHFFSPNPDEHGTIRATWENSRDSSTVWASAFPPSFDRNFVALGAVPWLKLQVVGKAEGPRGGDALTDTTFIQRINTSGGSAPATGCSSLADVGNKQFVNYTADYVFFTSDHGRSY